VLSPGRPSGKENSPLSAAHTSPHPPRTPGPRTPMPTVREHGGMEELSLRTPVTSPARMNPVEAWRVRSPVPPGLPEPSVKRTFITFESPLRTERLLSPPKSVPANHLFGSAEPDWWGLASPPPALLASPPAWPPSSPEPQSLQAQPWQLSLDVATLPLRLSDFLPDLPAVPSTPLAAMTHPAHTVDTMSTPVITNIDAVLLDCTAAVNCAEAVVTSAEPELREKSWAETPTAGLSHALRYTADLEQAQLAQVQTFDLDTMLHPHPQPSWDREHQFMQQMQLAPQEDQHQRISCPFPHELTHQMQPSFAESTQSQTEISQFAQLPVGDALHHTFDGHGQQMLQQQIPQHQMFQQAQDSIGSSQMPQQIHDPVQQLICDQMQQLHHTQQQMQHQEMQQFMHQQMEQQMQQHIQQQQLQEQTQQMINMLQHQLSQAQQPPSHIVAPPVLRAPVKLSELLQLPAAPPAVAPSDDVLGLCSGPLTDCPDDDLTAISMSTEAPKIAEKWADEAVVPTTCSSPLAGTSILSEVLREINDTEPASARASALRSRRNRGPRSGGRR